MAKNDKNWIWWIILGLAIAFVFLPKTGFLGSILTICDNTEPTTLSDFSNATCGIPGACVGSPTSFLIGNKTVSFASNLRNGTTIIETGSLNYTCAQVYDSINGTNGAYGMHEYKVGNGAIYWCNKAGTLLLYTSDPNKIASYYASYEVCRTQNYTGVAYEADPTVCEEKLGNWTGSKCMCPDGSQLKINGPDCPVPSREADNTSIIEPYNPPKTTTTTYPTTPTTKTPDRKTVYWIGGIGAALIALVVYNKYFKKKKR